MRSTSVSKWPKSRCYLRNKNKCPAFLSWKVGNPNRERCALVLKKLRLKVYTHSNYNITITNAGPAGKSCFGSTAAGAAPTAAGAEWTLCRAVFPIFWAALHGFLSGSSAWCRICLNTWASLNLQLKPTNGSRPIDPTNSGHQRKNCS